MEKVLAISLLLVAAAECKTLKFVNQHGSTVWVGALGNAGLAAPNNGGWEMAPGSTVTVTVGDSWGGRFWGRSGCRFGGGGTCETGDCGGKLQCNGAGGAPPATLAEFTFGGYGGNDFYDVSLVDGFNMALSITPMTKRGSGYSCTTASCPANINSQCPSELRQQSSSGAVVGCKSACLAFNTDQYCCRNAYGTPDTCRSSTWPTNYPAFFKSRCPLAYSYAYDDQKSTFTCNDSGYTITFL